jgi:hypothetical protein
VRQGRKFRRQHLGRRGTAFPEIDRRRNIHRLSTINDEVLYCKRGNDHCVVVVIACSPTAFMSASSPSLVFSGTLNTCPGQMRSGLLICS